MKRFWNIVYYFAYHLDYNLHWLVNKINPLMLIFKMPTVKRAYEKKGVNDMEQEINNAFKNPKGGISSIRSYGLLFGLLFFLCIGFYCLYLVVFRLIAKVHPNILVVFGIICWATNYFLVFRKRQYLTYFKKINKMPRREKEKWAWISYSTMIAIVLFMIGSFILMVKTHSPS